MFTFPGGHEEKNDLTGLKTYIRSFPALQKFELILLFLTFALGVTFCSALFQHTSAVTTTVITRNLASGLVKTHVGAAATALVRLGAMLTVMAFVGILVMKWSIQEILADRGEGS
jgi:hypothetical protein